MKYGPRKSARLLAQAKVIRIEEKLSWAKIADRLGIDAIWLRLHKSKLEGLPAGRIVAIPKDNLDQTLAKVKALRDQKVAWKVIGETLGIDWMKLCRSYRHHTEGSVRK